MRITPKIVGGVAGLMLAGSLLAAAPAGATTYSDDCSEPVGGGLSLGWMGSTLTEACVDGVGSVELPPGSDAEALIGLDDVGQVGVSVVADDPSIGASALIEGVTAASVYHGPYFPGTTITWAQVADTSVALFEHGDDRAVIVGCSGGNVTLGLSGTDLTTVPTVDDIGNCG